MENLFSRQPSKWTNDHNAKKLKEKPGGHADHAQNEENARPQRPPLELLLISSKNGDLWESPTQEVEIHGLPVTLCMLRLKSEKSEWLRIRNDYSVHVQKIGPWYTVLTKRTVASGNENVQHCTSLALLLPSPTIVFSSFERVSHVFHLIWT